MRKVLIYSLGVLLAGGCDSHYNPTEMGSVLERPEIGSSRIQHGNLCSTSRVLPLSHEVLQAERSVVSWLLTVWHTDSCNIGALRYYGSTNQRDLLQEKIRLASLSSPPTCDDRLEKLNREVQSAFTDIQRWIVDSKNLCEVKFRSEVVDASKLRLLRETQEIICRIKQQSPELERFKDVSCGT